MHPTDSPVKTAGLVVAIPLSIIGLKTSSTDVPVTLAVHCVGSGAGTPLSTLGLCMARSCDWDIRLKGPGTFSKHAANGPL